MALYQYEAWDDRGRLIRGVGEAATEQELYGQLKAQGLLLKKAYSLEARPWRRVRVPLEVLSEFSHQMAFILRSGVPIIHGMEDLRRQMGRASFARILEAVVREVQAGSALSQAMSKHPTVFPAYYTAVIHAGESAGNLDEAFKDMASYIEWVVQLRRQIKQALTYPIIVLFLITIALVIFITVVVPRLVSFIKELNRPLPLPTKVLVLFNEWMVQNWIWILVSMGILFGAILVGARFKGFRTEWDKRKLAIPIMGPLIRELVLLRFVKYLRVLYRAGIQIHQSFQILVEVVPNLYYKEVISRMAGFVMEGDSLANAMEKTGAFPPQVERSVRVGEQTGTLEESLEQLGSHLERLIDAKIKRLVSLIEPMLLMVVGLILIMVIASVLWPIYTILGEIS